jgi:hypothetical protein
MGIRSIGRKAMAALMAFALVAGACSDDGDDVSVDDVESSSTTEAPSETPDTMPESDTSTTSAAPVDLPASFRGVTETSIKVGVAVPDFDALQSAGIANYQGDADIAFQAFIDVINDNGGVFGRQIDPVYVSFDFLDPSSQDVACAEFVDDHEVFIVLYGLLTANNTCLTELNQTMVMTRSFQTSELRERSGDTLWLQLNASDDERVRILGTAVHEAGRLEGKTIGILASASQGDGLEGRVLQEVLADLGYESTLLIGEAGQGDPVATAAERALFAENFTTAGVDYLFDLTGGGNTAGDFADVGFTPELAFKAIGPSVDGADDRSVLDGAIGVGEITEAAMLVDDDFITNCIDVVIAANPDLAEEILYLPTGDEQAAGKRSWVNPIMIACDQTRLFDMIGEIAGADLTNDSFRAALDELGPVDLYGYGQASFGSESKWDGLDEFYVQEYDAASDAISVVGDPIIVDR